MFSVSKLASSYTSADRRWWRRRRTYRPRHAGSPGHRWLHLRILVAMALALLTMPVAGAASAEEADPTVTPETTVAATEAPAPAEETPPATDPSTEPAATEPAPAEPDPAAEQPAADPSPTETAAAAPSPAPEPAPVTSPTTKTSSLQVVEQPLDAYSLLADLSLLALVGGFEIDGNIPVDTNGNLDWENAGSVHHDGFGDLTNFSGSSKEFEHPSKWSNGSSGTAPGKSDIGDVYIYNTTIGGDSYSYFGFTRNDTTGTTAYDVEYNQLPNLSTNPPRPNRTPGDLLVQIAQQGSTGFYIQATYVWTLADDAAWDGSCTLVPGYTPAAGWCAFSPPAGAFDGAVSVDGEFAEGVLNLTALFGGTTCMGDFGVMNIRSRSSEALDAALKDWIAPIGVDIEGTCADLTIRKTDDAGNPVPGATFKIEPDPTPGSSATSLTITDGGAGDTDGTANGIVVVTPVEPGEYTVTETATPDGYLFPADRTQTVQVGQSAEVELVFENPRQWEPLAATKTATATYDSGYTWDVTKTVDENTQNVPEGTDAEFTYEVEVTQEPEVRSDFVVTGQIDVTNPNDDAVVATLTDTLGDGTRCDVTATDVDAGTTGLQVSVPGGGATYAYTCTYDAGDEPASLTGTNTASLTWSLADYPQTQDHVDHPGSAGTGDATASKDYMFTIDELTDPSVTVTDSQYAFDPAWTIQAVPAGQTVSKSYTKYFAGTAGRCTTYPNTATLTNGDSETIAEDDESVEVCVGSDLDVSKTVVEQLTRTYDWDVTKTADDATLEVDPDTGKVTASYDVTISAGDYEDSGWLMSGAITVQNPNHWQDVTLTGITDVYDGGGTCTVDTTDGLTVAKGASKVFDYTCTFVTKPAYTGTNTATITWDEAAAATPSGTDSGTAAVAAADWSQSLVNEEVTLVDDLATPADASDDVVLGTYPWSEGYTTTVRHTIELGTEPGSCDDFTNTASVVGEGEAVLADDDADVTVCWPVDLRVSKTADASYDRTYLWDVTKVADDPTTVEVGPDGTATFDYTVAAVPNGYSDDGQELSGTITVTNPNDYKDVTVDITDAVDIDGVTCEVSDGTDVVVPRDDSVTVDYTCDASGVGEADYTGGTNTATAIWDDGTATGTADVTFVLDDETDKSVDVYDNMTDLFAIPGDLLGTAHWNADGTPTEFPYDLELGSEPGECTPYTNTATLRGDAEATLDSAQETVTVCEEQALSVTKTVDAGYERTYLWKLDKAVATPTRVEVAEGGSHEFDYTVTATPNGYTDSGWVMEGTITVTNPNGYAAGGITADVVDTTDVGAVCTVPGGEDLLLDPGETVDLSYTCTFDGKPDYSGTNTATATWLAPGGTAASASGSADVAFEVGVETNKTVDVYDDKVDLTEPELLGTATWNEAGTPVPFTYSLEQDGVAGRCTDYTNTAWIEQTGQDDSTTVTVCAEAGLQVDKDVTASFDRTYLWQIDKSVDESRAEVRQGNVPVFEYAVAVTPDGSVDDGWEMAGTITVANPNSYDGGAITAEVTDLTDVGGGAVCTVDGGDEVTVAAGQTVELDYSCTFDSRPAYTGLNTATAAWTAPGGAEQEATAEADVDFVLDEETDKTIHVYDDKTDPEGEPVLLGEATWNDGGTPTVLTYDLPLEEERGEPGRCTEFTNTAWIEETGQDDDVTVTVCRYGELVVTKTAEASFDRTYTWDIDKRADRTRITTGEDGTATVGYAVEVTPTGYTDSGWEMTGTVTVHNPNDWADLTIGLEDLPDVGEGATCTLDQSPEDVVERGGTTTYTYTCTFEEQPVYDGDNQVVVDWRNDAAAGKGDREGSSSASTPVSFQVDEETDKVVTVVDEMAEPDLLGEVTWSEGGEPTLFEYSVDLSAAPGLCESVVNTATIVETGQDAQATVDVCGEDEILPVEQVVSRPPTAPAEIAGVQATLPDTGAPAGTALTTMLAGLSVLLGAWLLLRTRRTHPGRSPR